MMFLLILDGMHHSGQLSIRDTKHSVSNLPSKVGVHLFLSPFGRRSLDRLNRFCNSDRPRHSKHKVNVILSAAELNRNQSISLANRSDEGVEFGHHLFLYPGIAILGTEDKMEVNLR